MSISNNSELNTAVENWINRTDLTTFVPDFIRLAESRIATDLKTQHLMTFTTITADASSKALPSNFRGISTAYIDTNPKQRLDYMPNDEFFAKWASDLTGKPQAFTILNQLIWFGPIPSASSGYNCELLIYTTPDIASDTTNSLLTNYPDIYLFASMVEALNYIEQDPTMYENKYQQALQRIDAEQDFMGGMALQLPGVV